MFNKKKTTPQWRFEWWNIFGGFKHSCGMGIKELLSMYPLQRAAQTKTVWIQETILFINSSSTPTASSLMWTLILLLSFLGYPARPTFPFQLNISQLWLELLFFEVSLFKKWKYCSSSSGNSCSFLFCLLLNLSNFTWNVSHIINLKTCSTSRLSIKEIQLFCLFGLSLASWELTCFSVVLS